jgi:hypothetical protein
MTRCSRRRENLACAEAYFKIGEGTRITHRKPCRPHNAVAGEVVRSAPAAHTSPGSGKGARVDERPALQSLCAPERRNRGLGQATFRSGADQLVRHELDGRLAVGVHGEVSMERDKSP